MDVLSQEAALKEASRIPADILAPLRPCLVGAHALLTGATTRTELGSHELRPQEISDVTKVPERLGPVSADNPLAWGVHHALRNSGGKPVLFMPIADPLNLDHWKSALKAIQFRRDIYSLVPLTHQEDVWKLFDDHVNDPHLSDLAAYRALWLPVLSTTQVSGFGRHTHCVRAADSIAVAAALAGLSGAVIPQQKLDRVVLRVADTAVNAEEIAPGMWQLTKDLCAETEPSTADGEVRRRTISAWSQCMLRYIQKWILGAIERPEIRGKLRAQFSAATSYFLSRTAGRIGSCIRTARLRDLRPHHLFKDRIVLRIGLELADKRMLQLNLVS